MTKYVISLKDVFHNPICRIDLDNVVFAAFSPKDIFEMYLVRIRYGFVNHEILFEEVAHATLCLYKEFLRESVVKEDLSRIFQLIEEKLLTFFGPHYVHVSLVKYLDDQTVILDHDIPDELKRITICEVC